MPLSTQNVREALRQVMDPAFHKPMMEVGTLEVLSAEPTVTLRVRLLSPSQALKHKIQAEIDNALSTMNGGGTKASITWDLQIPSRQLTSEDPAPDVRNVVLVMSGKGGVGKSSCAVNLALALHKAGASVGLLDADIYGPSIPTMFGISEHPTATEAHRIQPLERFGLKLMSLGFLLEDPREAVVWRGPMIHSALLQFLKDVDWGKLDYLVLDLPPGTGDVALTLSQRIKVTGAVIVTTPQEVALQDVYKSVTMCHKLNLPILGIVENMSYFVDTAGVKHELFGRGGGEKVAEFAQAPLLGQVPLEPAIRECGDAGVPVVQAAPESSIAKIFQSLAEEVATRIAVLHFERSGGEKAPASEAPTRLKIVR